MKLDAEQKRPGDVPGLYDVCLFLQIYSAGASSLLALLAALRLSLHSLHLFGSLSKPFSL
jgi:hypothetical protein